MSDMERLNIALPAPLAAAVRAAVDSGDYETTSAVVSEALRLWGARRSERDQDVAVLRRAWDEGKASGSAGPLDMQKIIAEERSRLAENNQ